MNRKRAVVTIVTLAGLIGGWLIFRRSPAASSAGGAPSPVTALVTTQPIHQQMMAETLTALGEVTTGKVVAISFPRAGQVSRLLVLVGQRVKPGTPLATLASDPSARLAYAQAVSAADFASGELRRNEELLGLQLATRSQVDGARKLLQDAEANLAAQREFGGNIGLATVVAPFDGVVTAVTAAQGDRLPPGAAILQLGHTDVLRVRLGIEPDEVHLVRVGLPATLAPVDDRTQVVTTSITESQGLVDPQTRLVDAIAEVPATAARFLVPGMRVRATIGVGQQLSWAAPRAAVLSDTSGTYLFQVSGGQAHRIAVTSGPESQGLVAVSGPIDPKLPIVVLGNHELQDGMQVREGSPPPSSPSPSSPSP
jgi:membrane fusion protein (multidrug efflux system)